MKIHNPHLCARLADRNGVVTATRVAQPSVAKHLGRLRAAGPVSCERRGNEARCPVADATRFELGELFADRSRIGRAPSS